MKVIVVILKAALSNCPTHRANAELINASSKSPDLLTILVSSFSFFAVE
jgi:hypothetical protein